MTWLEALILGIIQGLTEFLPVSSSGHLEIGKSLLNIEMKEDISFTVMVHLATVFSTITVFRKQIKEIASGAFTLKWNSQNRYIAKILVSMIPVMVVGLLFKDEVESLFSGNLLIVGVSLLITALLLSLAFFMRGGMKQIPFSSAFIIGLAQAAAVIPGISRSGATISTGLILKNERGEVAKFSFLMVLIPVIGIAMIDILDWAGNKGANSIPVSSLIIGFFAAYLTGTLACSWMISIVKKGRLIWFAIYCAVVGTISIIFH